MFVFVSLCVAVMRYGSKCCVVISIMNKLEQHNSLSYKVRARLHRHAIFGDVPMSDTCWTPKSVRHAGLRCASSVSFFFFFARLRHGSDTSNTLAVKKKSQILTNGLTNTIDFVIYPQTKKQT